MHESGLKDPLAMPDRLRELTSPRRRPKPKYTRLFSRGALLAVPGLGEQKECSREQYRRHRGPEVLAVRGSVGGSLSQAGFWRVFYAMPGSTTRGGRPNSHSRSNR